MNLEHLIKFHNSKSVTYGNVPLKGSCSSLTTSDVMAAAGMLQHRAAMGYAAFAGKMNLSKTESQRAVSLLNIYAQEQAQHIPALKKLMPAVRTSVITHMSVCAFIEFARSAATENQCPACSGKGILDNGLCPCCKGKRKVRAACPSCKGRGEAVNRRESKLRGVPVYQPCKRCSGRGFSRIPSTHIFGIISRITTEISLDSWHKSVKSFYESLVTKLLTEESWAEKQLKQITK